MTQPANMKTVREIIHKLRDRVELLREENDQLRTHNQELRRELELARSQTGGSDEPADELEALEAEIEQLGLGEERTSSNWMSSSRPRPQQPDRTHMNSPPQARRFGSGAGDTGRRARDDDMALYTRSGGSSTRSGAGPRSEYYGAGVDPGQASQRGVTPGGSGPRPNLDLGYINDVGADELDVLPYGLIVLDSEGNVLFYNETEAQMAGYDREEVTGRNFFGEVAPCTRVKEFQGRFEAFVAGELGRVAFFDFAFHFEEGTQNVVIGLSHGRRKGHINVMLMRQ